MLETMTSSNNRMSINIHVSTCMSTSGRNSTGISNHAHIHMSTASIINMNVNKKVSIIDSAMKMNIQSTERLQYL